MNETATPTDARLDSARLIAFGSPGSGTPTRYVGPLTGSPTAKLNATTTALAAATTRFLADVDEVRSGAGRLLPSERRSVVDEAGAKLAATLRDAQGTVDSEGDRIGESTRRATGIAPFTDAGAPLHETMTTLALAQRFHDLPAPARVQLLAETTRNPAEHKTWASALLRADPVLSGITADERTALHEAALQAFKPELAAGLKGEQQQLTHARQAVTIANDALRTHAPTAWREMAGNDPARVGATA